MRNSNPGPLHVNNVYPISVLVGGCMVDFLSGEQHVSLYGGSAHRRIHNFILAESLKERNECRSWDYANLQEWSL
jgi:hypothetical protein